MRSLKLHVAYKSIKRLRAILAVFVRHGFQPVMEQLKLMRLVSIPQRLMGRKIAFDQDAVATPVRVRRALEELGPTFIKFGQILSTRPDVLPEEFITELLKLQDEVPPVPFLDAVRVIEEEFKRPVRELFLSIEETPVAAASIAQVHRAVTISGEEVVIKVQRPDIEKIIETDTAILAYLAKLFAKYIAESRIYDPVAIVEEFTMVISRELDFTLEASYTQKFRDNFADDPHVIIPKVYWELSGQRALTLERIDGVKADRVERLKEQGISAEKAAHLIADAFFKQVFEHGLFHGDLHSGNIFVLGGDRISFVDFGIVGRINSDMKERLADVLICFVTSDFERLTKVYLKMGILPEGVDRGSFEREYYDTMLHYFGRPFENVRIGELMADYIKLAARHNIRLPKELLLFDKCLIELEGLTRQLYPGVDLLVEGQHYAARLIKERIGPSAVFKEAAAAFSDYKDLFESFPGHADRILKKITDDKFRIEFLHRGLEDFMGEMDRSSNRLTFGIIVAALVIGSSMVITSPSKMTIMGHPALGIIGFVLASVLGLWLVFQIIRSGKF
ncbi:MAG: phosphotransferase [Deltaproteobacteria bacterium]|nr:phosphotransferase [Deltaproteobacteria bacterium]